MSIATAPSPLGQPGLEPWQNGERLARHLREQWNLGEGRVSDERLSEMK